jgi:hypothetical protein
MKTISTELAVHLAGEVWGDRFHGAHPNRREAANTFITRLICKENALSLSYKSS